LRFVAWEGVKIGGGREMKSVYLMMVMSICFATSLSIIVCAADLTVKVRDSTTGETIYEDEKTYSPKEREQMRQHEIMRRQLLQEEQAKQARGGLPALPAGSPRKVQLEYQKLIEAYNKKPCEDFKNPESGDLYTAENCKKGRIDQMNKLIGDPDYYFYKKDEADKHRPMQVDSPAIFINK
jgi:hypothetical protein